MENKKTKHTEEHLLGCPALVTVTTMVTVPTVFHAGRAPTAHSRVLAALSHPLQPWKGRESLICVLFSNTPKEKGMAVPICPRGVSKWLSGAPAKPGINTAIPLPLLCSCPYGAEQTAIRADNELQGSSGDPDQDEQHLEVRRAGMLQKK